MRENFIPSLGFVFRHECVYAPGHYGDSNFVITENVAGDGGGLTKFGIDAADHPGLDIANLTLVQATEIYHDGEWTKCLCDSLPDGVDTAVFDCAVNNGCGESARLLQRAINGCGGVVEVDGEIGPKTVAAASEVCQSSPWRLIEPLLDLRRDLYGEIVADHPVDAKFLPGWLNRVADLETFLHGLIDEPQGAI